MPKPLDEYSRKRSFERTPEPKPEPESAPEGRVYCIQRHHARRLHYDLRLQLGGTLKSWAVPQGPSLDPAVKRLAVMVEDHPLQYAVFEGTIPKGNYGAGSVMLWDRGWWEPAVSKSPEEMLEKGDFKFVLHGEKLRGEFVLAHMKGAKGKGNDWLLIKKKDAEARPGWDVEQYAYSVATGRTQEEIAQELPAREPVKRKAREAPEGAVSSPMPHSIQPMLAVSAAEPPGSGEWLYEVKWDGVRALCFLNQGQLRIAGRKGTSIERQYPELGVLPHHVAAESAILDGEIAAVDENGRPSFEHIQPRIMARDASAVAQLARSRPVVFFAFDLLYWNGFDLRGVSLKERRKLLEEVVRPGTAVRLSETFDVDPRQLLEAARAQGLEGIVAKRTASLYQERRSADWVKVKATREQEFVLCGYTHGERDFFGALVLGVYEDEQLEFAGSVGTGFDRKLMKQIRERLDELRSERSPFREKVSLPQEVQWVRPELVCTVRFLEWTNEGRVRAPVFVGLRDDIDPSECTRSEPPAEEPARKSAPLLPGDKAEATIEVEGHRLQIRNLNKVFFPGEGITKREVLEYYNTVAELLIPYWKDRPLSLRRYPDGIAKEGFFQKDASGRGFPDWLRKERVLAEDGKMRLQVIGDSRAALVWLANLGCIDQNPWMSRVGSLDNPDFLLIDLDPQECSYSRVTEAAQLIRRLLEESGLTGCPKTTGGKGMHIYVPLDPVYSYDHVRAFAEILARLAERERPDLFTLPRAVSKREKGTVYFDYLQIARGKTISAPYVLRAHPAAPVATPLDWSEVRDGLEPALFNIRNALARFERTGDLFEPVLKLKQRLEPALERLEKRMQQTRKP